VVVARSRIERSRASNTGGEAVEVRNRGFVLPYVDTSELIGVLLTLARSHDCPDRCFGSCGLVIPPADGPVLSQVEVGREHDAMPTFDHLAASSGADRALVVTFRPWQTTTS
jgi:hypothetical protein